jgi:hypothetical protein
VSWRSSTDLYRMPITVDHTGAVAGVFDATATIPADMMHFWSTVQSTGNDIRVVRADGITAVTKFDLDTFSTTNKTGTLEIQDTAAAQSSLQYWLMWGDSGLSSGVTAFVPVGPKPAYIDQGAPAPGCVVLARAQERPGETAPIFEIAKDPDSTIYVWFVFGPMLQQRVNPSQGSYELETLTYCTPSAAAGLTVTVSATRFEDGRPGRGAVKIKVSGGTTANDYIITATAGTSEGRVLTMRAKVKVRAMA